MKWRIKLSKLLTGYEPCEHCKLSTEKKTEPLHKHNVGGSTTYINENGASVYQEWGQNYFKSLISERPMSYEDWKAYLDLKAQLDQARGSQPSSTVTFNEPSRFSHFFFDTLPYYGSLIVVIFLALFGLVFVIIPLLFGVL